MKIGPLIQELKTGDAVHTELGHLITLIIRFKKRK